MEFAGIGFLGWPGWLELHLSGGETVRVLARFREKDGRLAVTTLIVDGDVVDSAVLRGIPIGRIESWLNSRPGGSVRLLEPVDQVATAAFQGKHLFSEELSRVESDLDKVLSLTRSDSPPGPGPRKPARIPLERPDGSNPDAFAARVADAYNEAMLTTSAPARVIAAEAGVPVGTAHRWIREARQRGKLPPGRQGRAG